MPNPGQNNWAYAPPYNVAQPGSQVQSGGGGSIQLIGFRDILDARRTMLDGRVPSAEYPDGYLGTIVSRRNDRLLQNVQNRLTQRSYQRGVHKGERIDPRDYYWTNEVNPQAGLEAEAKGLRFTQRGTLVERLAHMGKAEDIKTPEEMAAIYAQYGIEDTGLPKVIDPVRRERMGRLLPEWR
jgi:hypothetical protein